MSLEQLELEAWQTSCKDCGTDPEGMNIELNKLQVLIEGAGGMIESKRLIALDRIYDLRHLIGELTVNNLHLRPWKYGG